jgi:hypothetical protein
MELQESKMLDNTTRALSTSLLQARLGTAALMPHSEQLLVTQLQAAASTIGCASPELVTTIYLGLKLRLRLCVCGAHNRTLSLFDQIASVLVGTGSDQRLLLASPLAIDDVSRRFAAIRINDFVSTALDPGQQDKMWFIFVNSPDQPNAMVHWLEQEVMATVRTEMPEKRCWPANLFVLVASEHPVSLPVDDWLSLQAPAWKEQPYTYPNTTVPPVGYQRFLLKRQLTGSAYQAWLRTSRQRLPITSLVRATQLPPSLANRWLAASVDNQGQGLWVTTSPIGNAYYALKVLKELWIAPTDKQLDLT